MKILVYLPRENDEHITILQSFMIGLLSCNCDAAFGSVEECINADVAVIFGIGKKMAPVSHARGRIYSERMKARKPTIVIEKGFINRDEYYMAGWNGLNNRAMFLNDNMPSDRWDALGVELKPYKMGGDFILICGQVPWDASVQHTDHIMWIANTINEITKATDENIMLRPHPLAVAQTPYFMGADRSTKPLQYDLDHASMVITFNSNTGVDAIINGNTVFASDVGSMIWDVANKQLSSLSLPAQYDRRRWANNIAYTQWNIDEMSDGLPWQHLSKYLEADIIKDITNNDTLSL